MTEENMAGSISRSNITACTVGMLDGSSSESESSDISTTQIQVGATKKHTYEERVLKAMEKMEEKVVGKIETFDKRMKLMEGKMTLLEGQMMVLKKQPPVSAIGNRELMSGVMSPLSSNASFSLTNNKKMLMKSIEGEIGKGLRDHLKKQWYSEIKFVEHGEDEMDVAIIEEAIQSKSVRVPDGIHDSEFISFFRNAVKRELAALRHNTQTLARRNWKGKKRYK